MSTDIRAQKKAIQDAINLGQTALQTGQTAQNAADAAASAVQVISGTVQTISAEMVRKFTSAPIDAAAFVLDAVSGYYYATISHMLGDAAPDIEVYDNDKDKQSVQSIVVDNNTVKLELTSADMTSNSFPLTCIVLGKNTPVTPGVGEAGIAVAAKPGWMARYTPGLKQVQKQLDAMGWVNIIDSANILEARLGADGTVHTKDEAGNYQYAFIDGGAWVPSNPEMWSFLTPANGAIVL